MRPAWPGFGRGVRNPLVCGRKFCPDCGRWRHACDFRVTRHHGKERLDSYCDTCRLRFKRRARSRWTPEQRALHREYQRFWTEAQRRAVGTPSRTFRRRVPSDRKERSLLSVDPILTAINQWLQLHLPEWRRDPDRTVENLGSLAGLDARTINRYQSGESRRIQLNAADKLAMALDTPLSLLYPDEDEQEAAA